MSVSAVVEDGKIQTTSSSSTTSSSNTLGKDDFLQLLVAQMKYQDPLEPTSNTEYISQYATFSQVEQMQNMSESMDLDRASSLVGKTVIMDVTDDSTGETTQVSGKVDYVVYQENKAYLSINESLYALEDLSSVCDDEYLDAYAKAKNLVSQLAKLPAVEKITLDNQADIESISSTYSDMTDYEKTFIATSVKESITKYSEKLQELLLAAEQSADSTDSEE